jgi:signal peptidase I
LKNLTKHKTYSPPAETFRTNGSDPDMLKLFEDILKTGSSLRIKVTGRSMSPFLKGNEILSIKKVPVSLLKKGDLILFKNPQDVPVIHRIIKKSFADENNSFFQTKGDALFLPDSPVSQNDVLGKVCKIEQTAFLPWAKNINMESFCWKKVNFSIAMLGLLRTELRSLILRYF